MEWSAARCEPYIYLVMKEIQIVSNWVLVWYACEGCVFAGDG